MVNVTSEVLELIRPYVLYVLHLRQLARELRDWDFADELRDELGKLGLKVEDYKDKSRARMKARVRWVYRG